MEKISARKRKGFRPRNDARSVSKARKPIFAIARSIGEYKLI
jgi:hypothetical protein